MAHFFRHEGGVANIERTGNDSDRVHGVVHRVEEDALAALDQAEAYPDWDHLYRQVSSSMLPT